MNLRSLYLAWLGLTLVPVLVLQGSMANAQYMVRPITESEAKEYDLDTNFYSKVTEAEGILIATSSKVSDLAHLRFF